MKYTSIKALLVNICFFVACGTVQASSSADMPPVLRSNEGPHFQLTTLGGVETNVKVAYSESGEVYSCFDRHPKRLGFARELTAKTQFGGKHFFCVSGFDKLESAGLDGRLKNKIKNLKPRQATTSSLLGGPTTAYKLNYASASKTELLNRFSISEKYPQFSEPKAWIRNTPFKAANRLDNDGFGFRKVILDDDGDYPPDWNPWGEDIMWPPDFNPEFAINPQCNLFLAWAVRMCVFAGPAYPECVAGAVLIYLTCISRP